MRQEVVNYTTKNIREFQPGDTIYINKSIPSGHVVTWFCEFVKFERGVVYGKAITATPDWAFHKSTDTGKEIKARLSKCYLWGKPNPSLLNYNHCNWFKKDGTVK